MRNLEPRMDKCADYRILEPAALKGNWRSLKPDATQLWVEFYIVKTFGNIAHILDIPNEIYSRGNYFKLPELINMNEQLKSKIE